MVVAFGLVWSLGGTSPAFATKDSEKQAELKARQAFAASRYDEAIEIFAQLYAETLNPIYVRNIGRCHQKKREPEKAIDAFQDYLAKSKSITPSEKKEIQGYIKEMEELRDEQAKERQAKEAAAATPVFKPAPPAMGPDGTTNPTASNTVAINAANPNAINTLPPPNDPGTPTLVATPGTRPPEESRPIYKRWWFWTALGVVAAGGVAAALLIPGGVSKPFCPTECK